MLKTFGFCRLKLLSPSHPDHLTSNLNLVQDGCRLIFSWPFSYISFSYFTFPGSHIRFTTSSHNSSLVCYEIQLTSIVHIAYINSTWYKTVSVMLSLHPSLIFLFRLLPSPVHLTGFSLFFLWFPCHFYLVIEQQQPMEMEGNFLPKLIFSLFCDISMLNLCKIIWNHIDYHYFYFI